MPASQEIEYEGYKIAVRPAFWLRRWTLFPLYFQAFKPSFEVRIAKVSEPAGQPKELKFSVSFANNTEIEFRADVSMLGIGAQNRVKANKILLAPTGDATIRLDMRAAGLGRFYTLYAFYISSETALVFLILGGVFAAVWSLVFRFLR